MRTPREIPLHLRDRTFTAAEGRDAGMTTQQLRHPRLRRPFHGVYRLAPCEDDAVVEYGARLSAGQYFSHTSAARLHGMPLPAWTASDRRVFVIVEAPARAPRVRGVIGRHVDPGLASFTVAGGLPVVSAVDTWAHLATLLGEKDLVVAGDWLVRRQNPLARMSELDSAVARMAGRRGVTRLRGAFARVRPGTDSPKETEIRLALVDAGLPEPDVNPHLVDRWGVPIGFGDLAYPRWRVLVEYDGEQHRTSAYQYHRDVDRLEHFMADGWRVIRINRSHRGRRLAERVSAVREALWSAGWRP